MSEDYHDYVIKDGKLIGKFEEMYSNCQDPPWNQDKQDNDLDVKATIDLLEEYNHDFSCVCDFSSGLGYFLDIINRRIISKQRDAPYDPSKWIDGRFRIPLHGFDISKTCCARASEKFPDISFETLDLSDIHLSPLVKSDNKLVILRATLWYVYPFIDTVIANLNNQTKPGDHLLISQNFPPLDSDFVGKEVIPNPERIKQLFSRFFAPIRSTWIEDYTDSNNGNDNWYICLFKKKD
jgi:hypothetical protein